jgi:hypothetical protein
MTKISDETAMILMRAVQVGCPDGGLSSCYSCAKDAIKAVIAELQLHVECVRIVNFNEIVTKPNPTTGTGGSTNV